MKKRVITFIVAAIMLTALVPVTVSAMGMRNWRSIQTNTAGYGYGYGMCGEMGYGFMWDDDGNFVDRETFESRIDEAIDNDWIPSEYKENYLNMYDYCAKYGASGLGSVRGGGRGCCGGAMWYYIP